MSPGFPCAQLTKGPLSTDHVLGLCQVPGPRQVSSPVLCRLVHGPHWGEFLVQSVKLSSELRRCLEPHSKAFFSGSPLGLAVQPPGFPKARTSPWEGPWAGPRVCGKAAGRCPCRRPGCASHQLAHLYVCPGTQHPSCVYAHPGARAFKTRLIVFLVLVLVTKQCAPAQATTLTVWTSLPCPVLMAWGVAGLAGTSDPGSLPRVGMPFAAS